MQINHTVSGWCLRENVFRWANHSHIRLIASLLQNLPFATVKCYLCYNWVSSRTSYIGTYSLYVTMKCGREKQKRGLAVASFPAVCSAGNGWRVEWRHGWAVYARTAVVIDAIDAWHKKPQNLKRARVPRRQKQRRAPLPMVYKGEWLRFGAS